MIAKNLESSLKFFRQRTPKLLIGVFVQVHSISAANRTWSAFVPLCKFVGGCDVRKPIAIILRTRYFPYLYS